MTFFKSGVSRATRYLRLKHLVKLLDARINFALYGPDAIAFVHRGPPHRFRDQVQHILLPKSSIGLAAQILSKHNGYNIFDKPPFPESCAELRLNMYRPIVSPDIPSGPVVLHHPDGEDYVGIEHLFLHASSAFHFDLDDPTKTFTDPDPPHPSVAAVRYPTEIAFIDSLIDTLYEPPFTPRLFNDLPWHDWLTALVESSVCEYPNEWESEEMDLDFDEDNFQR